MKLIIPCFLYLFQYAAWRQQTIWDKPRATKDRGHPRERTGCYLPDNSFSAAIPGFGWHFWPCYHNVHLIPDEYHERHKIYLQGNLLDFPTCCFIENLGQCFVLLVSSSSLKLLLFNHLSIMWRSYPSLHTFHIREHGRLAYLSKIW